MAKPILLPRLAQPALEELMAVFPVVVVMGARQTGKSTLARVLTGGDRPYLTLDDLDVLAQAQQDPRGLLTRAPRLIIDEVQRAPNLLLEIKRLVDDGPREPGRFILTGSTNLLLGNQISESLAGRAGYLTLRPMTRGELAGDGRAGMWDTFFDEPLNRWAEALERSTRTNVDWKDVARIGGYPVPAHELTTAEHRSLWFAGYAQTYLERDLQQLAAIEQLTDFRRLMVLASLRTGGLLNQAELARDAGLSHATAHRYLNLLDASFQTIRLQTYAGNRSKRVVKSPKLYWSDPGLGMHVGSVPEPTGAHLENLIVSDLTAWRASHAVLPQILHWRTYAGTEVDVVVEHRNQLLAVEIKATTKPRFGDTRGLRTFLDSVGDACVGGVLLHGGSEVEQLSERVVAVPWWLVV